MDLAEAFMKALEIGVKQPTLIFFLVTMAVVAYALYVVLQVVREKNKDP